MNTADRIQSLRKAKGMSQEELADKIGVSRQAVSKWESEQSLPDIDKIILLSDFFEVTTDYILKGIETEKQATGRPPLNAMVFFTAGTALNFVGLVVSCAVWYERQVPMAIVAGLILMAMGCMNFGIGWSLSTQNKEKAKRLFWTVNIWLLSFIPLSMIYNGLFSRVLAPYPLIGGNRFGLISFLVFWLVYIAACLAVILLPVRMKRRNEA